MSINQDFDPGLVKIKFLTYLGHLQVVVLLFDCQKSRLEMTGDQSNTALESHKSKSHAGNKGKEVLHAPLC